jgi:hypothetical protein
MVNKGKPHHSFVYTVYNILKIRRILCRIYNISYVLNSDL